MTTTISGLADACGAKVLGGRLGVSIDSAANIDEVRVNQLSLIAGAKQMKKLAGTAASAVIVPLGTTRDAVPDETCLLVVTDPEFAFIACLNHLYPLKSNSGMVSPKADIDSTAIIGAGTSVAAFVTIGARTSIGRNSALQGGCRIGDDVTLGDGCVLYPNVVLYDGVTLGDNVIIHAGSVIGSDGFGYKFRNGEHVKFPQVGTVVIESNVEIGSNTCIDRASLGATRVGEGTKIDNQVHIAHNVKIGAHALVCGQVGIGGSTVIEDRVVLASQCGIADHVTVGKHATVLAQAGVTKNIDAQDQVMGFPAVERREALHQIAALRKLSGHYKAVDELVGLLPKLRSVVAERL